LHLAAANGRVEAVKLLLMNKAEVDARTKEGWTPLHRAAALADAAMRGDVAMAELLLAHKAEVNPKGRADWTPLRSAQRNGQKEVEELLRKHGAKD
jgi:ankyrin repeat protein